MISFRFAQSSDLEQIVALIDEDPVAPAPFEIRQSLYSVFRSLLGSPGFNLVVWERRIEIPEIVAFAWSALVKSEFLVNAMARVEPLEFQFYDACRHGQAALLSLQEIAVGNALSGVQVLARHFRSVDPDPTSAFSRQILSVGKEAFFFLLAGHRCRSLHYEIPLEDGRNFLVNGRFQLLRSISMAGGATMHLGRMRAEDIVDPSFSVVPLFFPASPKVGLSPQQQRIALYALTGMTDRQIAESLGLAADTVRQCWPLIYRKLEVIYPELFLADEPQLRSDGGVKGRGSERRRLALDFLREHPQELRPWS